MNTVFPEKPPVLPVDIVKITEPVKVSLDNGIPVYLIEAGIEEVMRIDFTFDAGQAHEYLPLLASTTNMMLSEGSVLYTSEDLNEINQVVEKLEYLGFSQAFIVAL